MPKTPFYYIKAPLAAVLDESLPDPVFRTMCKLLITARENRYWRTPAMTIHEMAAVAGVCERTMWNHLSVLRQSVHVSVESPRRGHLVVHFPSLIADDTLAGATRESPKSADICTEKGALSAQSADLCSGLVVVDSIPIENSGGDNQQQPSSGIEGGMGGGSESAKPCTDNAMSAKDCTERPSLVVRKLAEMGIVEPTRSELAACPWATDDYALGWALWKSARPDAGPGVIIANWRKAVDPPEISLEEMATLDPQSDAARHRYVGGAYADFIEH